MNNEPKYYGVSSGDGNNGVSQLFPDYIVKTDDPWQLAYLASLSEFKAGEGQEWAKENMEIDGEEDYTIYVIFMESAETQEERKELEEQAEARGEEFDHDSFGCDYAWLILEIFPLKWDEDMSQCQVYESLEDCFGEEFVKANAEKV